MIIVNDNRQKNASGFYGNICSGHIYIFGLFGSNNINGFHFNCIPNVGTLDILKNSIIDIYSFYSEKHKCAVFRFNLGN